MKYIVDYVEAGKPIIGIRTATHAFEIKPGKTYSTWSWKDKTWDGGFGRQVLGETWVDHHGKHKVQSTRARFAPGEDKHPILRGIRDGEDLGPYQTSTRSRIRYLGTACRFCSERCSKAWVRRISPWLDGKTNPNCRLHGPTSYKGGRVFTTTMGSSQDLKNEAFRRLLVNAAFWATGQEKKIPSKPRVDIVGAYNPTPFGFGTYLKGKKPEDY